MSDNLEMKLEHDLKMQQIKEELLLKLSEYKKTIAYMSADAPITILCLPPVIEKALLDHGCLRVYDLFDMDFTKVKGLGASRIRYLTSRLDEFFSML